MGEKSLVSWLKIHNMVGTYEYPDFPMDEKTFGVKPGQFIPGEVLHDYLTQFAKKFGVYEKIRFTTKVESAEKKGKEGWLLGIKSSQGRSKILSEKLVVATGMTSEPFMTEIEGSGSFEAPIFHVKSLRERAGTTNAAKEVVILDGTKRCVGCCVYIRASRRRRPSSHGDSGIWTWCVF